MPYTEECLEALKWISMEVEQEHGDALVMKVNQFENLSDDKLIDIFKNERSQDYQEIEKFLKQLELEINSKLPDQQNNLVDMQKWIKQLRKTIDKTSKIDYFRSFDKSYFVNRLQTLQKSLLAGNLIVLVMLNVGTLDNVVLKKMKEESCYENNETSVEIKRLDCRIG